MLLNNTRMQTSSVVYLSLLFRLKTYPHKPEVFNDVKDVYKRL